jgi:DNA-binding transcriptional MerR regulator
VDEERLISKKEVLEKLGISYGQLYRWKRKGLIPESWFIRKATFTGQETFFPEDRITTRIKHIVEMKDDYPLDQLANLITTRVNEKLEVAFSKLQSLGWLDDEVIRVCQLDPEKQSLSFQETLCIYALRKLETTARKEEIELAKKTLDHAMSAGLMDRLGKENLLLSLLRKRLSAAGISAEISLVTISAPNTIFDPETEITQSIDLQEILQQIKLDLGKETLFPNNDAQRETRHNKEAREKEDR